MILWIYISISCIRKNKTANHLKLGQQLLGCALTINPYEIQPRTQTIVLSARWEVFDAVQGYILNLVCIFLRFYHIIWHAGLVENFWPFVTLYFRVEDKVGGPDSVQISEVIQTWWKLMVSILSILFSISLSLYSMSSVPILL